MKKTFIKVDSSEIAEKLVSLGFQYIAKEQNAFVFPYDEEIIVILQQQYSCPFVCESKLRF